jgi:hypothetical protein
LWGGGGWGGWGQNTKLTGLSGLCVNMYAEKIAFQSKSYLFGPSLNSDCLETIAQAQFIIIPIANELFFLRPAAKRYLLGQRFKKNNLKFGKSRFFAIMTFQTTFSFRFKDPTSGLKKFLKKLDTLQRAKFLVSNPRTHI